MYACRPHWISVASASDTAGHPYAEKIAALLAHGITNGCSDTEFCPNSPVTRGQAAMFVVRALNLRAGRAVDFPAGAPHFADVVGHYSARHVQRLYELGITRGTGNDAQGRPLFSPDAPVKQG